MITATFVHDLDFIRVLYIVAFGLFIYGLSGDGFLNKLLLVIAVAFGTINVVGGFLVTDRMLEMFKGKKPARDAEGDPK